MSTVRGIVIANAIAAAVAVIVASAAWAVPPRQAASFPGVANAAPAAAPAVPTFVNGMAQAVFATGHGELGQPRAVGRDRRSTPTSTASRTACTSTSRARRRPRPTGSRSRSSTRTARTTRAAPTSPTGPSTTRSARRRHPRPRAPYFNGRQHEPDDQHDLREHLGAARLRRRALRVARHRQLRRLPELRRPDRDARRDGGHRLAQRPRQGLHDPRRRRSRSPPTGTTATSA